ncbi:MAG: hypothetical protein ACK4EY_15155 [Flavipsychrobacter sp.]
MKKSIFIAVIAIIATAFTAKAQVLTLGDYSGRTTPFSTSQVTVTNTGLDTFILAVSGDKSTISLQIDMAKTSGDPSGVTIKWYTSDNGGLTYTTAALYTDTMNNGATRVSHTWTGNPHTHYMAVITGAGTAVSTYKGYANIR